MREIESGRQRGIAEDQNRDKDNHRDRITVTDIAEDRQAATSRYGGG